MKARSPRWSTRPTFLTCLLHTHCTTRHMVRPGAHKILFNERGAKQINPENPPFLTKFVLRDRTGKPESAWRSTVGTTGNPGERLSRAEMQMQQIANPRLHNYVLSGVYLVHMPRIFHQQYYFITHCILTQWYQFRPFLLDKKIVIILFRTSNNFNSFNIELRSTEMLFSCFSIHMKSYGRIIQVKFQEKKKLPSTRSQHQFQILPWNKAEGLHQSISHTISIMANHIHNQPEE